jgi:hypothetical protein
VLEGYSKSGVASSERAKEAVLALAEELREAQDNTLKMAANFKHIMANLGKTHHEVG